MDLDIFLSPDKREKFCHAHTFPFNDFTEKEKTEIAKIFKNCGIVHKYSKDFSYWKVIKYQNDGIVASRFTWHDGAIFGVTFQEFEDNLKQYKQKTRILK